MTIRDDVIYVLQTVGQLEGRADEVADAVLDAIVFRLVEGADIPTDNAELPLPCSCGQRYGRMRSHRDDCDYLT